MCKINSRELALAHTCDLAVIIDAAPLLRRDSRIEEAIGHHFEVRHEQYDTLSFIDLSMIVDDPDRLEILVTDIRTAIGLRGTEKVLVCSANHQVNHRLAGALSEVPGFERLRIRHHYSDHHVEGAALPLILACMDWRLHGGRALADIIKESFGTDDYHLLTTAGVAKELVKPSSRRTLISRQIREGIRRGLISEVILLNHMDCGKYGGSIEFADSGAEIAKYSHDLLAAKEWLMSKGYGIPVRSGIISFGDNRPVAITMV